jgi:hypothetical protein
MSHVKRCGATHIWVSKGVVRPVGLPWQLMSTWNWVMPYALMWLIHKSCRTDWRDWKGPSFKKKLLNGFISQILIKKGQIRRKNRPCNRRMAARGAGWVCKWREHRGKGGQAGRALVPTSVVSAVCRSWMRYAEMS